jgi:type IV secretory pathway VirB10-like protein
MNVRRTPVIEQKSNLSFGLLPALLSGLLLAGCGGAPPPPPPAAEPEKAAAEAPPPAPPVDEAAAQVAAKEAELAKREQELTLKEKEAELAQREAALAAKEKAAKKPASTAKPPAAPATAATAVAAKAEPPPPPKPTVVPAGTKISAELVTPLSTKTNRTGDRIEARVLADVMVDGKRAIPAGAIVSGTVTERVSGSQKIGATPMIGVAFDTLAPDADRAVAISSTLTQVGKSEGGQDAAKIAGGAAVGAVLGHQVAKGSKGTIIGGVLGAAAGAAVAKNTGTEVEVPAGTVISLTLDTAVELKP